MLLRSWRKRRSLSSGRLTCLAQSSSQINIIPKMRSSRVMKIQVRRQQHEHYENQLQSSRTSSASNRSSSSISSSRRRRSRNDFDAEDEKQLRQMNINEEKRRKRKRVEELAIAAAAGDKVKKHSSTSVLLTSWSWWLALVCLCLIYSSCSLSSSSYSLFQAVNCDQPNHHTHQRRHQHQQQQQQEVNWLRLEAPIARANHQQQLEVRDNELDNSIVQATAQDDQQLHSTTTTTTTTNRIAQVAESATQDQQQQQQQLEEQLQRESKQTAGVTNNHWPATATPAAQEATKYSPTRAHYSLTAQVKLERRLDALEFQLRKLIHQQQMQSLGVSGAVSSSSSLLEATTPAATTNQATATGPTEGSSTTAAAAAAAAAAQVANAVRPQLVALASKLELMESVIAINTKKGYDLEERIKQLEKCDCKQSCKWTTTTTNSFHAAHENGDQTSPSSYISSSYQRDYSSSVADRHHHQLTASITAKQSDTIEKDESQQPSPKERVDGDGKSSSSSRNETTTTSTSNGGVILVKSDGEVWANKCDVCSCHSGQVRCKHMSCPELTCANPHYLKGKCCPVCLKPCYYKSQKVAHGDKLVINSNQEMCKECLCQNGRLRCQRVQLNAGVASTGRKQRSTWRQSGRQSDDDTAGARNARKLVGSGDTNDDNDNTHNDRLSGTGGAATAAAAEANELELKPARAGEEEFNGDVEDDELEPDSTSGSNINEDNENEIDYEEHEQGSPARKLGSDNLDVDLDFWMQDQEEDPHHQQQQQQQEGAEAEGDDMDEWAWQPKAAKSGKAGRLHRKRYITPSMENSVGGDRSVVPLVCPQLGRECPQEHRINLQNDCCTYCADYDFCAQKSPFYCHPHADCLNNLLLNGGSGGLTNDGAELTPQLNVSAFELMMGGGAEGGGGAGGRGGTPTSLLSVHSMFKCQCKRGFEGDGRQVCRDINECARADMNSCDPHTTECVNLSGSYECRCKKGFKKWPHPSIPSAATHMIDSSTSPPADANDPPKTTTRCVDIDECADGKLNRCHPQANCINLRGSYKCRCKRGFLGNGHECHRWFSPDPQVAAYLHRHSPAATKHKSPRPLSGEQDETDPNSNNNNATETAGGNLNVAKRPVKVNLPLSTGGLLGLDPDDDQVDDERSQQQQQEQELEHHQEEFDPAVAANMVRDNNNHHHHHHEEEQEQEGTEDEDDELIEVAKEKSSLASSFKMSDYSVADAAAAKKEPLTLNAHLDEDADQKQHTSNVPLSQQQSGSNDNEQQSDSSSLNQLPQWAALNTRTMFIQPPPPPKTWLTEDNTTTTTTTSITSNNSPGESSTTATTTTTNIPVQSNTYQQQTTLATNNNNNQHDGGRVTDGANNATPSDTNTNDNNDKTAPTSKPATGKSSASENEQQTYLGQQITRLPSPTSDSVEASESNLQLVSVPLEVSTPINSNSKTHPNNNNHYNNKHNNNSPTSYKRGTIIATATSSPIKGGTVELDSPPVSFLQKSSSVTSSSSSSFYKAPYFRKLTDFYNIKSIWRGRIFTTTHHLYVPTNIILLLLSLLFHIYCIHFNHVVT